MSRTVEELLTEALVHFDAATAYAETTTTDPQLVVDAMSMRLFAGLETLTRLPDGVAERLFPGEWPDMRGLRHRIAHGYGAINLMRVRATVTGDLPNAVAAIRRELDQSGPSPQAIEEPS
ncbi:HepT-like ribonuclease domain-containing protein [Nocardioides sp. GY 10127]|uniref:HepT-like ribonuclease domain-containing protein n=1 Tax=Nocardioides sp. GY 10127 TaxID=2569762 RepID=UPI0010A81B90|nr:HepT-like ribonuclease domain-containing protein [Nocardioides sp. GY 10127]TIC80076.1 DUF86 domain-containing protein [Nocardioides sp. GY 10127]